ncbi:hypothetical protein HDV05_001283 [Chytridiales sp. JEL 0842]|nr:hypothetical protein HDV05_001283 [Chytridiales sp. JEL 0842]
MGKPHNEKVMMMAKAVANNTFLASPYRMGHIPIEMKPYRNIMPTFMHGKRITFTDKISDKSKSRTKRAIFPNVINRYVYSRLLDMNIYARITTTTLREIEKRGGFDEYVLTIGKDKCDDDIALMYKRLIEEAFVKQRDAVRAEEMQLIEQNYDAEYAQYIAGPLSIAQYMRQCLTHPLGGYYMTGEDVFGAKGDFTTSPEISQMFGELLGVWFVVQWQALGSPTEIQVVELGPGRGTLMSDIVRTMKQIKSFAEKAKTPSIHLVEASPSLRKIQAAELAPDQPIMETTQEGGEKVMSVTTKDGWTVQWHDDLSLVPQGKVTLAVAHEFFDAMPVYQFEKAADGWREVMIDIDTTDQSPFHFRLVLSPSPTKACKALLQHPRYSHLPLGTRIEISPDSQTIATRIAERIQKDRGAALFVDYGKEMISEASVRGIRKHEFTSILSRPGEVDLSADVDFATLREAVQSTGAQAPATLTQSTFLRAMGIVPRLQQLLNVASPEKRKGLVMDYERLVGSSGVNGMGEVYRVMAVVPGELEGGVYPFLEGVVGGGAKA